MVLFFFLSFHKSVLGDVPIGHDPDKDLYRLQTMQGNNTKIIDSRWSAFGRTDLVKFDSDLSTMAIFIDGAAGANMLRFNNYFPDTSNNLSHTSHEFGGILPMMDLPKDWKNSALVIGSGGGRDVLLTLLAGYKKITAVDINPQMISIVKDYSKFNGGIYNQFKNVKTVVAEGRNFLRRSNRKYDLITLFMPITKSSQSLNAFALSESYLFTKDAFKDYYDHLTDKGVLLVMAHNMVEAAKMLTTAVSALQTEGMSVRQAMSRMYILGSDMMPLFGMRKSPVQNWESSFLHSGVHNIPQFDSQLSYIPGVEQQMIRPSLSTSIDAGFPMMNPVFINLSDGSLPLKRLETGTELNLIPPTDDRPFFFQYDFSVPSVLLTMLWIALGLLAAILFFPGAWFKSRLRESKDRHNNIEKFSWWLPVFFVSIGIGYIVIELSLFQKLLFYLGDPSRSLALLLAALLAGSGVGSISTSRLKLSAAISAGIVSALLALIIQFTSPELLGIINEGISSLKILAAAVSFLQGLPMGMMFPLCLRFAEKRLGGVAIPWMWAINGSASVVGSAIAIIIAVTLGYNASLISGAIAYLIAAAAISILARQNHFSLTKENIKC